MNTKEMLTELLSKLDVLTSTPLQDTGNRLLKFTEKEIIKMPKTFRKEFRAQGCTAHVRKRTDGRYKCSYEIRYNRNGYSISASATTLEKAKERFIEKLNEAIPHSQDDFKPSANFGKFAMYWFENFHKRKVCESTYSHNIKLYNRHIQGEYAHRSITSISAASLQQYIDKFIDRPKTSDDVYSILNQIFNCAVNHGLIRLNPLNMCVHKIHEREHGRALSIEEERILLSAFDGTPYQTTFAVLLYTGLRPSEYPTAKITEHFIIAQNSKRKGGKIEYKRIPITPMLRPYIYKNTTLFMPSREKLYYAYKKILPNSTLYDLRTTFQTRCTECGIADTAIGLFMGNSIGALKKAYTDVSDEYLIHEGNKLKY